jgi:predicted glutamine amidotransferase
MCLAIVANKKSDFNTVFDGIRNAWDDNPHGAGFAYYDGIRVEILVGYTDPELLIADVSVKMSEYISISDFLIHLRYASSGDVNNENCHPFFIIGKAMIYNGTLQKFVDNSAKESDTSKLARYLSNLPDDFTDNTGYDILIEDLIGTDKMAILDENGSSTIYNIGNWKVEKDVYFSNDYYKKEYTRKKVQNEVVRYNQNVCYCCKSKLTTQQEQSYGICETCQDDFYKGY